MIINLPDKAAKLFIHGVIQPPAGNVTQFSGRPVRSEAHSIGAHFDGLFPGRDSLDVISALTALTDSLERNLSSGVFTQ